MTAAARPGVCIYCGCNGENHATPPAGESCVWLDKDRTVCSAPSCMARYHVEQKIRASRKGPTFRIDDKAGRVRRFGRRKKGGKAV